MRRALGFSFVLVAAFNGFNGAAQAEPVEIATAAVKLTAEFAAPTGAGPHPAVVLLHGCNGMRARDGARLNARHREWHALLTGLGFAVLSLDSFSPRGVREVCTLKDNSILPRVRADDVKSALQWLGQRPDIDSKRLVLLGWSHGGSTVLASVRQSFLDGGPMPVAAIAFYPGCSVFNAAQDWRPALPLTILTGALDNWTPASPCREVAARVGATYVEYPDAYHGFDANNVEVQVRADLPRAPGGRAHFGTNRDAREKSMTLVRDLLAKVKASP